LQPVLPHRSAFLPESAGAHSSPADFRATL
jgi:hypothetical protein